MEKQGKLRQAWAAAEQAPSKTPSSMSWSKSPREEEFQVHTLQSTSQKRLGDLALTSVMLYLTYIIKILHGNKYLNVNRKIFLRAFFLPDHRMNCISKSLQAFSKVIFTALAGVTQFIGLCPANQKVTSSIPGQGTRLGCRFSPQSGCK